MFIVLTSLKAQNSLYVKEISNQHTIYGLSNVQKLKFNSGDLTVYETSGNTDIYSLNGIRYLSFSDFLTTIFSNNKEFDSAFLFPNPATEEINIFVELAETKNLTIDIINIQGKTIIHQIVNQTKGTTKQNIDISILPDGLYICRLQYGNQYKNIKFIKN